MKLTPVALVISALLITTSTTFAYDLGARAGAKPPIHRQAPPADPTVLRQGGDTIADAVPLDVPYAIESGTTVGYTDDYDEVCPFQNSTSPDVVYLLEPEQDMVLDIDMFGSTYDTKIYVYDDAMNLVACNDDFYPDYVSKIEGLPMIGGTSYYLIIDGYGGDAGDYVVTVTPPAPPCILDCTGQMEYEPPLVDGYQDAHNGGCNSPEFGSPFQSYVWGWFCGTSGWYSSGGSNSRDTDWFEVSVVGDYTNPVMITVDAEQPTYVFELAPQDCGSVEVVQTLEVGPCAPGTISIPVEPGQETIWLWVGPTTFEGPVNEYKYTLFRDWWTTTETTSWSAVKGMFD